MPSTSLLQSAALFKQFEAGFNGRVTQGDPTVGDTMGAQEDDDLATGKTRLRAVFISDLHIGTPGFQAEALLDFLRHHPSDVLYLVGDIVDGWQLRRRIQKRVERPERELEI
jgi:hypothetical protein